MGAAWAVSAKDGWNPLSFRVDEEWECDSQVSDKQSISTLLLAQRISKSTRRVGADKLPWYRRGKETSSVKIV